MTYSKVIDNNFIFSICASWVITYIKYWFIIASTNGPNFPARKRFMNDMVYNSNKHQHIYQGCNQYHTLSPETIKQVN